MPEELPGVMFIILIPFPLALGVRELDEDEDELLTSNVGWRPTYFPDRFSVEGICPQSAPRSNTKPSGSII